MEEDNQDFSEPILWPAEIIRQLAPVFETSTTGMARILGMSRHVVWRRIHRHEALPPQYQARAMGAVRLYVLMLDLYGYQTISGRREARRWMNDWLRAPRPRSVWRRPIECLGSDEDQERLLNLVERIVAGAYM